MQDSENRINHAGFGIQDTRFRIQDTGLYRISEYRIDDKGLRIPERVCRIENTGYMMQD